MPYTLKSELHMHDKAFYAGRKRQCSANVNKTCAVPYCRKEERRKLEDRKENFFFICYGKLRVTSF